MVPVVGKPCMEHILDLLGGHGMNEVVVTLAFMPQAIRTYFGGSMATPPRSAPEKSLSEPSRRPIGVLAPATITEVGRSALMEKPLPTSLGMSVTL